MMSVTGQDLTVVKLAVRSFQGLRPHPTTAKAELCELAFRQVSEYSRRSGGCFPEPLSIAVGRTETMPLLHHTRRKAVTSSRSPRFGQLIPAQAVKVAGIRTCGKIHRAAEPEAARESVQYGHRIKALAVYLTDYQLLPLRRTADLLQDLWGAPISPASVDAYAHDAGHRLIPVVEEIRDAARASAVLHLDESGLRVGGGLHWLHTAATPELSWYAHHSRRGLAAFESFDILPRFTGTARRTRHPHAKTQAENLRRFSLQSRCR